MRIHCCNTLDDLAAYAHDWERLADGVPFRGWTWLSTWWRHYGRGAGRAGKRSLCVPCVFDDAGVLVGLAPWYLDSSVSQGQALGMLGSGEVCSDYLGVLCQKGKEEAVTAALADYLCGEIHGDDRPCPRWDLLELTDAAAGDAAIDPFIKHLSKRGNAVHRQNGPNCWRLELPNCWDEYLPVLSKNRRYQVRRLVCEYLDSGRAVLRVAGCAEELSWAMDVLIDLHQRRRQSLAQRGCFASPRFTAFYREVVPALFAKGQVQLYWLELDGKPASVEWLLAGQGVLYVYQGGLDPDVLEHNPGYVLLLAILRRAIGERYRALDFLRGDEPYKAHLRAQPYPSLAWRVVANRPFARWRHNLWLAENHMKRWIKGGLRLIAVEHESCRSGNNSC